MFTFNIFSGWNWNICQSSFQYKLSWRHWSDPDLLRPLNKTWWPPQRSNNFWHEEVSFGHVCIMNAAHWPPCLFNRGSLTFYIFPEYRMVFMSKDIKQGGTFKILLLFYLIRWNEQNPSGFLSLVFLNRSVFLNCIMKAWFIHVSSFSIQDTKNMKKKPERVVEVFFRFLSCVL